MAGQRERETLKEGGASPKYLPKGPFGQRVPREPRKDNSLWHPTVPSKLTWATGSGENSWWMKGGRMARGLCPAVGWSRRKESVEKRKRERPIFFGPIKPYTGLVLLTQAQGVLSRRS